MDLFAQLNLSLENFIIIFVIVFIASIIRGFDGFGFSATCVSGFSYILPAIEVIPIILILEVVISIFMIPYIWNKIDWKFVFQLSIGIMIGSPVGLYLLQYLSANITHLLICLIIIFFSILLMKGFYNQKINNAYGKTITGFISGILNGFSTLGGLPVALFLLIINVQATIIRGSLAALFFLTDIYAFILSSFVGIVNLTTIFRILPLIIAIPIGVFIGNKFFTKSKETTYRKIILIFLIIISFFGIFRSISTI